MRTKEYVKKYRLDLGNKFYHGEFVADLTIDFITALEVGKATESLKGFEQAVRVVRMKWDAISNKTKFGLPESLWKYFYATVIMTIKKDHFSEELDRIKKEKERRNEEWKERKTWENETLFGQNWMDDMFNNYMDGFKKLFKGFRKPISSIELLKLDEDDFTMEDVKTSYRDLAKIWHPDQGGNHKDFIEITEAKNKCLAYLRNVGEIIK